jgi:hypothetical protein
MITPTSIFVLCLLVIILNAVQNGASQSAVNHGEWSTETQSIMHNPDSESVPVSAPDRRTVVTVEGINVLIRRNRKTLPGVEGEAILPLAELAWSPDSKAFFITWSEGGSVGNG